MKSLMYVCWFFLYSFIFVFSFFIITIIIGILISSTFLIKSILTITVTEVHIMSIKSGRTDYVIAGESVQLSCHYMFTKPYERVLAVNWKKDGQPVRCFFLFFFFKKIFFFQNFMPKKIRYFSQRQINVPLHYHYFVIMLIIILKIY